MRQIRVTVNLPEGKELDFTFFNKSLDEIEKAVSLLNPSVTSMVFTVVRHPLESID